MKEVVQVRTLTKRSIQSSSSKTMSQSSSSKATLSSSTVNGTKKIEDVQTGSIGPVIDVAAYYKLRANGSLTRDMNSSLYRRASSYESASEKTPESISTNQQRTSPEERAKYYYGLGDWWNVLPKTDYLYSQASPLYGRELVPGVPLMPNLSRRPLNSRVVSTYSKYDLRYWLYNIVRTIITTTSTLLTWVLTTVTTTSTFLTSVLTSTHRRSSPWSLWYLLLIPLLLFFIYFFYARSTDEESSWIGTVRPTVKFAASQLVKPYSLVFGWLVWIWDLFLSTILEVPSWMGQTANAIFSVFFLFSSTSPVAKTEVPAVIAPKSVPPPPVPTYDEVRRIVLEVLKERESLVKPASPDLSSVKHLVESTLSDLREKPLSHAALSELKGLVKQEINQFQVAMESRLVDKMEKPLRAELNSQVTQLNELIQQIQDKVKSEPHAPVPTQDDIRGIFLELLKKESVQPQPLDLSLIQPLIESSLNDLSEKPLSQTALSELKGILNQEMDKVRVALESRLVGKVEEPLRAELTSHVTQLNELIKQIHEKLVKFESQQSNVKAEIDNMKKVRPEKVALTTGGDGGVALIKSLIEEYHADRTAKPDYALISNGGMILSIRCTQPFDNSKYFIGLFWGIEYRTPDLIITPGAMPGQCWAFEGAEGYIVIKLALPIHITAFTMEHTPKVLTLYDHIKSAPHQFSVWGLESEKDTEGVFLGRFKFLDNENSLQTFEAEKVDRVFQIIELKIESNHGHLEYTCLYRFRVHGRPS